MFKKLHELAVLPSRATSGDAGLDLYAIEDIVVPGVMGLYQRQMSAFYYMIQKAHNDDSPMEQYSGFKVSDLFDLSSCTHRFRTGVALEIPNIEYDFILNDDGEEIANVSVGLLWDKSGIGDRGIHRLGGVIDYGYRGEIMVRMVNFGMDSWIVTPGTKICQIVLQPVTYIPDSLIRWMDDLGETERGSDGFGSSGQ